MKIAVLLLAHKNKKQVEDLVTALQHDHIDVFIHLDSKADWNPEDFAVENVTFTACRYDVGLFEYSMVEAERELIETARSTGEYQYYILMSGQCYPIIHTDELYHHLCAAYPEPMIEIVAPTEKNYVKVNFQHVYIWKRFKLSTYAFLKKHFSYRIYRILRYFPGGLVWLISMIKEWFVSSPKKRLEKRGMPMYCGSQWWVLPDRVIENVLPYFNDLDYCTIVSDTFSCDETFFQTAIMDRAKDNGIQLDEDGNYMNRRWFYIFDGGHPILLTKDHVTDMRASGMFFARKFDATVDAGVLQLLEEQRVENKRL